MIERNIRLTLAYDGTDFSGWQRQASRRSVQEELEKALERMHTHPVRTVGAGRTDSGVHAAAQVAHFFSDIASIPADKYCLALNKLLPRDLRVLESSEAHPDFHARYDARLRRYKYFMVRAQACPPWRARYALPLRRWPDVTALNRMASALRGECDFTAFSSAKDPSVNKFRFVHDASFHIEGDALVFEIAANAFLWRMVRSIVGSLLHFESEGSGPDRVIEALKLGERSLAGPSASAHALFLWNVEYYPVPTRPGRHADRAVSPIDSDDEVSEPEAPRLVPGYGMIGKAP